MSTVGSRIMNWLRMLRIRGTALIRSRLMLSSLQVTSWWRMMSLRILGSRWRKIWTRTTRGRTHCWSRQIRTVIYSLLARMSSIRTSRMVRMILLGRIFRLLHLHSVVGIRFTIHTISCSRSGIIFIIHFDHGIRRVRVCWRRRVINWWRLGPSVGGIW